MTDGRSWEGNWKVRLYERVRERGCWLPCGPDDELLLMLLPDEEV